MGTDYKVGIGVVLCLALAFTIWYVATRSAVTPSQQDLQQASGSEYDRGVTDLSDSGPPDQTLAAGGSDEMVVGLGRRVTGGAGGSGGETAAESLPSPKPAEKDPSLEHGYSARVNRQDVWGSADDIRATPPPSGVAVAGGIQDVAYIPDVEPDRTAEAPMPYPAGETPKSSDVSTPIAGSPAHRSRDSAGTQIYVVKDGDLGFWAVAMNSYGRGDLWPLIQKANPGVDPRRLRPGQRLNVPPRVASRAEGRSQAPQGEVIRQGGKDGYYIVRKGDAGLWGISKNYYGRGSLWPLIDEANPDVKASSILRPGQKLLMPKLPSSKRLSQDDRNKLWRPLQAGERPYTVRPGDRGLWDVAEKMYGNGMHWSVVAAANPQTSGARYLHPGQKLIVPKLPTSLATRHSRTDRSVEPGDGKPIFD